jgi:hypothetical protein
VNLQVYPVIQLIFSKFSFCICDREHDQLNFDGHSKVMFMLTVIYYFTCYHKPSKNIFKLFFPRDQCSINIDSGGHMDIVAILSSESCVVVTVFRCII